MTDQNLATGIALKKQLDAINAAQASIAAVGSAAAPSIVNGDITTVSNTLLRTALGADYATVVAASKTSLSTALGTAETAAQSAYDALA